MRKFHSQTIRLVAIPILAVIFGLSCTQIAAQASDQADNQDPSLDSRDANSPQNRGGGAQSLSGANGDTFMEEVVSDKPKPTLKPIPIDLSRVGVSVDPHGNIVPLRDSPNDPWAASGVKPFYNHIESTTTMPYVYQNPYAGGLPYGRYPGYGYGNNRGYGYGNNPGYGFGGYRYPGFGYGGNPGYGLGGYRYPGFGYGGNPAYGLGAYRYPGLGYGNSNPYYPGYSPFNVGYTTTGNSATFLSNDPTTGAPLPQGQQGNAQSNFTSSSGSFTPGIMPGFMPGLTPGPWLAPTTSYSQNSMWKAFNLGF
jgi:hypothetical protein